MNERPLALAALMLLATACERGREREPTATAPANEANSATADANAPAPVNVSETAPLNATVGNAATPVAPSPAAPTSGSAFTSLDPAKCRLVEKNEEEGGYFRYRCPATAGYVVDLVESDLRQSLDVRKDGRVAGLALSSVAGNGAFNRLGRTIEWRGPQGGAPRTLTVCSAVATGEGKADRQYLVVVRLVPRPCAVAVVAPGPDQSAQARIIADRVILPQCLG